MFWPKFIIRRNDWQILVFMEVLPNRDVAMYGRLNDRSMVSLRTAYEIKSGHDLFTWGVVK